jgi:hypothetical protein
VVSLATEITIINNSNRETIMKLNNWEFYVRHAEDIRDGTYVITINDDVLDPDCWPVHSICVVGGYVRNQIALYSSQVYDVPDMMGWTTQQIAEWTQIEPGNSHPQVGHEIMRISVVQGVDF